MKYKKISQSKNLESVDDVPESLKRTDTAVIRSYTLILVSRTIELWYLQHYLRSICFLSPKWVIATNHFQLHQMSSTKRIAFMVRSKTHLCPRCTLWCRTRLKTHEKLFGCLEQIGNKEVVIDFDVCVRNFIRKMQPDTKF